MYSKELMDLVANIQDKKYMISLSKMKPQRTMILEATSWMENFVPWMPLKLRALAIQLGYTEETFPKCPQCDNPVTFNKFNTSEFNKFCSDPCSKKFGRLDQSIKEKLASYDWVYEHRITKRMSFDTIALILDCSVTPVGKACIKHGIPSYRYNESKPEVLKYLRDYEWMYREHVTNHRQLWDMGDEIGTTVSTLSVYMAKHGIPCNPTNSYDRDYTRRSLQEISVEEYIQSLGFVTKHNNRSILNGKEVDIVVPSKNIGFEYNGLFSHVYRHAKYPDVVVKTKDYHLFKTQLAKEKGITLFHIWSDDWLSNQDVVKSMIKAKLGVLPNKVFARKCQIVSLEAHEKHLFLDLNHLQGKDKSSINYALKHDDETVAIMTFCKARYNKNYNWELSRFACKQDTNIVGGFSKLLKHFRAQHEGSIISYADRCASTGNLYEVNGFRLLKTNPPGYSYTNDFDRRYHRQNFVKKRIAALDDPRTEEEIMLEKGYMQVYDCGTLTYVLD